MSDERNIHWLDGISYSWITDNLAVGGFLGINRRDDAKSFYSDEEMLSAAVKTFDVVVLCCDDTQPSSDDVQNAVVVHMGFREQLLGPIKPEVLKLIEEKVLLLDELLTGDKKMLCSCAAGAARSPFVAASLLKYRGMPAEEAVRLIQKRRIISNFLYVDYLLHGDDDYEIKWFPTIGERRKDYWRNQ